MSSLPPIPPAVTSSAGAIGSRDSQPGDTKRAASTGAQPTGIEASAEGGDRDADGRDLREHERRSDAEILEQALEDAAEADESGGLDVSL